MEVTTTVDRSVALAQFKPEDHLTPEELTLAQKMATEINITDWISILSRGVPAQKELSAVADRFLQQTQVQRTGPIGETLTALVDQVQLVDMNSLSAGGEGLLARIPMIGVWFSRLKKFLRKYNSVAKEVNELDDKLGSGVQILVRYDTFLGEISQANELALKKLVLEVAAEEYELRRAETELAQQKAKVQDVDDIINQQRLREQEENIFLLRDHIARLRNAVFDAVLGRPMILATKSSNNRVMARMQDGRHMLIPQFKRNVALAIALYEQEQQLKVINAVDDANNQMRVEAAKMLRQTGNNAMSSEIRSVQEAVKSFEETVGHLVEFRKEYRQMEAELVREQQNAVAQMYQLKQTLDEVESPRAAEIL